MRFLVIILDCVLIVKKGRLWIFCQTRQAAVLSQNFLKRITGYQEIRISPAGEGRTGEQGQWFWRITAVPETVLVRNPKYRLSLL